MLALCGSRGEEEEEVWDGVYIVCVLSLVDVNLFVLRAPQRWLLSSALAAVGRVADCFCYQDRCG